MRSQWPDVEIGGGYISEEKKPMPQRLMTLKQVAAILNCTVSAVRRWQRENRITTIKIGRLVRVSECELDRIGREGIRPTIKGVR